MKIRSKALLFGLAVLAIVFVAKTDAIKSHFSVSNASNDRGVTSATNTDTAQLESDVHLNPPKSDGRQTETLSDTPQTNDIDPASGGAPDESEQTGNSSEIDLATKAQVTKFLEKQNYGDMIPLEINALLNIMTLGEGAEFERNRKTHVVSVSQLAKKHPSKVEFINTLNGRFTSEFVDTVPSANEQPYSIELNFSASSLDVSFILHGKAYYSHQIADLKNGLGIASSEKIPPNLFVTLPAKAEIGYLHPLYLELIVSSDRQTILGILYNTDQNIRGAQNYLHAEHLIFRRIN